MLNYYPIIMKLKYLLEMKLISLPAKISINKAEGGLEHSLNMTKINISLKLFKALLVNRLQVQGEANMNKHQFWRTL